MYYDKIVAAMNQPMTPYIIEERQLNISQLDVF
jgi:ATP-dependent Clp protease protease subunit